MRRIISAGLALTLLLAASMVLAADSGRAFEISDYYKTAMVGNPAISPDGSQVAFSVRRYNLEKGKTWSEIWMMGPEGTDLHQMTFGQHNDVNPLFSPDGKQLLFVSGREGSESQLYVMSTRGGEAHKLTDFSMGLSDPTWSPDGKWIAVSSSVYPECGADGKCNEKILKEWKAGKLKAHMAEHLLYRHWTSWKDGRYTHILLVDAKDGKVAKDMTPGEWVSPTFSLSGDRGYTFSPDSKELCFVSNHEPDQASSTNADLWVEPVQGEITQETPTNLTVTNKGWDGAPLYSPDGRYIAYRSQATPGYESDLFRIALYDRVNKQIEYLTSRENYDNWVDEIAWAPDSKSLFFQGEYQGRNPLYRIDLLNKKINEILTDHQIDSWKLSPEGRFIVYGRRGIAQPPEIFRASADGANQKQLTNFNGDLVDQVDLRPAEEMWVPGEGDYKIQVFVIKPHGFDPSKKYPLILNVHGGPQSQWTDAYRGDWQVYPGKGYVVAFANPTGSTGHGQTFTEAISCDWGGRVFRDLMRVTDAVSDLPYVDNQRMGAMGWSYGGYMMMWFEGHTQRFKAIAAMMGVYDLTSMYGATEELWFPEKDLCGQPWNSELYRKWSPSEFAKNFKTPTMVITGELDYRVPYTQGLEFFTALQKMKVPSRLVVFPDAGHWPSWYEMAFYYDLHLDWFHKYLGGEAAPWDVEKFLRNQVFKQEVGE